MTDKDIAFFFSLKKGVEQLPYSMCAVLAVLGANSYFGFIPFLGTGVSLGLALALSFNLLKTLFKDSNDAKSYKRIEKLVNRDAELVKRVSEYKNV